MSPHLSRDQIDDLLQGAKANQPDQSMHRYYSEEAQKHLDECASCQALMRTHEDVMERLALLNSTTSAPGKPICPPADVWLDIAAKIVHGDSQELVNHAAQCDHCGPLLRQSKEDFAEELAPEEESSIAGLSSSTTDWQKSLAVKLHRTCAMPKVFAPRYRWPSLLTSLPAPSRLAFAVALLAVILLGVREYRRTVYLQAHSPQSIAQIQRLPQSLRQQNSQVAELTAGLSKSTTPVTAPGPQPNGNVQVASVSLDPGLTRGIAGVKRLTIPPGADMAKITLRLAETPDGRVREDLVTAGGEKKWSQELRPLKSEKNTHSLSLLLPAYLLTPNDYQILLSRESPDGLERFATYTFRVIR